MLVTKLFFKKSFVSLITLGTLIGTSEAFGMKKGFFHSADSQKKQPKTKVKNSTAGSPLDIPTEGFPLTKLSTPKPQSKKPFELNDATFSEASRFFEKKYAFSRLLLNHKAIDRALFSNEVSPTLFLNAYVFDALENKTPASLEKVFGFFTKPFLKHDFRVPDKNDLRFVRLVDAGVECLQPWAFFEKGELEKTSTTLITIWHYLAASRGYEPAQKYVSSSYSKDDYPLLSTRIPPDVKAPLQQIMEFFEEWKNKKYVVPLIDLNEFLKKNGLLIFKVLGVEVLDVEIAKLKEDKDRLYKLGCVSTHAKDYSTAIELFELSSTLGHSKATLCAWDLLRKTNNNSNDLKILSLSRNAAEQGDAAAMYDAGCILNSDFDGHKANPREALPYFKQAATLGHVGGAYNTGCILRDGFEGQEPDKKEALEYFKQAAALGDTSGTYNVGCILLYGFNGHKPNPKEALPFFLDAARAGHMRAMVNGASVSFSRFEGHEPDGKQALGLYIQAAGLGDVGSMYNAGCLYHTGFEGQAPDESEALKYYLKAGELGDAPALLNAGSILLTGFNSREPNEKEALELFKKAAALGNVEAMYNAGSILMKGFNGQKPNDKEAFEYFKKAATMGHVEAMYEAGCLLREGKNGLEANEKRALEYFKQAARAGHLIAICNAAAMLANGFKGHSPNKREALPYVLQAANLGRVRSMYEAGCLLKVGFNGQEPNRRSALDYFKKAAAQGDTESMYEAGIILISGFESKVPSEKEALENLNNIHKTGQLEEALPFFKNAADLGHIDAAFQVGVLMFGFIENDEEAMKYFKMAAEKGHIDSMYHVGDLYLGFYSKKPNFQEALKWLLQAASHGHAEAAFNAGCLLGEGFEGQQPNKKEAFRVYQVAAQKRHAKAICNMGFMLLKGFDGQHENKASALASFKDASSLGDSLAMYQAGVSLLALSDYKAALNYFEDGASLDCIDSIEMAGAMYLNGFKGQEPDGKEALKYFKRAAALGAVSSMYNAGATLMSFKDRKSVHEAVSYFSKAANLGDANAMLALCKVYLFEFDDLVKAEHWFERAKQINPTVTKELEMLVTVSHAESMGQEGPLLGDQATSIEIPTISILTALHNAKNMHQDIGQKRHRKAAVSEKNEDETNGSPDSDSSDESQNESPKAINKKVQLAKLAKGLEENNEKEQEEYSLSQESLLTLKGIQAKDKGLEINDLRRLFEDPFFKTQILLSKTKSGFSISAINRSENRNGTCGTHRKHNQTYDGFDWNFLSDLWNMLNEVYDLEGQIQ